MPTAELAAAADPMIPRPHVVLELVQETGDTATVVLEPVAGPAPAPSRPGQFHMLWVFGVGEVPVSVSGADPTGAVAHTVRAVGPVTAGLVAVRPGEVIGVRGPFGSAWDLEGAKGHDVVVVAGGIGLAPLRPVVQELLAARSEYGHVAVLVGARAPDTLLFGAELDAWRGAGLQVEVIVDHATPGWRGDVGVVTRLVGRAAVDPAHAAAMICGPELMMRLTVVELLDRGFAPERVTVSLERNMQCAIGLCGHCQLGPAFVCKDGPVLPWPRVAPLLGVRER